jgi:transposase-like protein
MPTAVNRKMVVRFHRPEPFACKNKMLATPLIPVYTDPAHSKNQREKWSMKRRKFTPEQQAEMLAFAKQHGPTKACEHFKIHASMLYNWKKRVKKTKPPAKPAPQMLTFELPPQQSQWVSTEPQKIVCLIGDASEILRVVRGLWT